MPHTHRMRQTLPILCIFSQGYSLFVMCSMSSSTFQFYRTLFKLHKIHAKQPHTRWKMSTGCFVWKFKIDLLKEKYRVASAMMVLTRDNSKSWKFRKKYIYGLNNQLFLIAVVLLLMGVHHLVINMVGDEVSSLRVFNCHCHTLQWDMTLLNEGKLVIYTNLSSQEANTFKESKWSSVALSWST